MPSVLYLLTSLWKLKVMEEGILQKKNIAGQVPKYNPKNLKEKTKLLIQTSTSIEQWESKTRTVQKL